MAETAVEEDEFFTNLYDNDGDTNAPAPQNERPPDDDAAEQQRRHQHHQAALVAKVRACHETATHRLAHFLNCCAHHKRSATWDAAAHDRWAALDAQLESDVLRRVDTSVQELVHQRCRATSRARKKGDNTGDAAASTARDIITRLHGLQTTAWTLLPHQLLRDLHEDVLEGHFLKSLRQLALRLADGDRMAVPWPVMLCALETAASERRARDAPGRGRSKNKQYQIADLAAAEQALLADSRYVVRETPNRSRKRRASLSVIAEQEHDGVHTLPIKHRASANGAGPTPTSLHDPARPSENCEADANEHEQDAGGMIDTYAGSDDEEGVMSEQGDAQAGGREFHEEKNEHAGRGHQQGRNEKESGDEQAQDDVDISGQDNNHTAYLARSMLKRKRPRSSSMFDFYRRATKRRAETNARTIEDLSAEDPMNADTSADDNDDTDQSESERSIEFGRRGPNQFQDAASAGSDRSSEIWLGETAGIDASPFLRNARGSQSFAATADSAIKDARWSSQATDDVHVASVLSTPSFAPPTTTYGRTLDTTSQSGVLTPAGPEIGSSRRRRHSAIGVNLKTFATLSTAAPLAVNVVTHSRVLEWLDGPTTLHQTLPLPDDQGIVQSLQPGHWLTASAITSITEEFIPRDVPRDTQSHRVFSSPYLDLDNPTENKQKAQRAQKYAASVFYIPINVNGRHWVLGLLDRKVREFELYNPMPLFPVGAAKTALQHYTPHLDGTETDPLSLSPWAMRTSPALQQSNMHDCGICVIVRAICHIRNHPCPTNIVPIVWRRFFASMFSAPRDPHSGAVGRLPILDFGDGAPGNRSSSSHWIVERLACSFNVAVETDDSGKVRLVQPQSMDAGLDVAQRFEMFRRSLIILKDESSLILMLQGDSGANTSETYDRARRHLAWYKQCKQTMPEDLSESDLQETSTQLNGKISELASTIAAQDKILLRRNLLEDDICTYTRLADDARQLARQIAVEKEERAYAELRNAQHLREAIDA